MNKGTDKDGMREGIIDAAKRLMAQYGYRKMTMSDLAAEAGIGVGTTYLYFSGKDEVALAVVERANRHVLTQLQSLADSEGKATARLRAMLIARVMLRFEMARPYPQQHREEFRKAIETTLQERRTCWQQDETQLFVGVLRTGQAQGEFESVDADELAPTLLLATNALMPGNLHPHEFAAPDQVRLRAAQLADLLLRAVLLPTAKPTD